MFEAAITTEGLWAGPHDHLGQPITENAAITELAAAVDRFRARTGARTAAELGDDLRRLSRIRDLIDLEFSRIAAAFADTDAYYWAGSATPVDFIRHECKMSGVAATNAVYVGDDAPQLAESVAALENGRIGFGHLALISGTVRAVRATPSERNIKESDLLAQAVEHSVGRFRHDCAHARHVADAEGFLGEQVDAVEFRRLELRPCGSGSVEIRGMLDAAGAATLRTALEPLARRNGRDDGRLRHKRMADALVEAANHVLDTNRLPQRANQRPHVQVTTTLETLRALPGAPAGDMEFAPPISAETVRRLACDCSIVRVLFGAESMIVDVGRAKRVVSAPLWRALCARDRGCVWPGCDRTASWTQAHHVIHWTNYGPTDLSNLALLCFRHHWTVHEGGWQLVRSADGVVSTIAPPPLYLSWIRARNPQNPMRN